MTFCSRPRNVCFVSFVKCSKIIINKQWQKNRECQYLCHYQMFTLKWALIWRLPGTKTLTTDTKLQQLQCKVTVIVLALKRSISVTPSLEESSVSAESLTSIWQQRQTEHTKNSNNSTQSTILAVRAGTFPSLKLNQNLFSSACKQKLLWGFRTGDDFHTGVLG